MLLMYTRQYELCKSVAKDEYDVIKRPVRQNDVVETKEQKSRDYDWP